MKEIIHSDIFDSWLHKLRDSRARFRIYKRIERLFAMPKKMTAMLG